MARAQVVSDDDIRRIARVCFLKNGPGVSVQIIADRLGVTPPAIYKRFGNKRDLLLAAFATPLTCPWPNEALLRGPDAGSITDQLEKIAHAMIATIDEIGPALRLFQDSDVDIETFMAAVEVPDAEGAIDQLTGWFDRAVKQGHILPAEPRLLAAMFHGAILFHKRNLSNPTTSPEDDPAVWAQQIVSVLQPLLNS